ncbi:ADP-ribosylglycohydrolase family protein [Nocardia thailandica]|uniref:ADP-ribosylglycohydrolase family protein n=1 Tax=Nocardia thailandica TaxID=257275 RepID=UPI0002D49326|nr:ADP-ribosylglycohydrolase family protein [Nocardia thailandica]
MFAGFVIERELGRGGMGAVYAARHPRLPRLTALKLLHRDLFTDGEVRARFEREADLVAQLDHPNIITVYDRGHDDEQLWISMQFVDGTDASAVPAAQLGLDRIAEILTQTADALDYAHSRGVLHRDVKPANILLSRSAGRGAGFTERVLLTDFGIAKLLDGGSTITRAGQFTATIPYASPEQLTSSPLDGRSDQYSLACTAFRLLTGAGPFDAPQPATVMLGHLHRPPPAPSERRAGLPPALDAVFGRALAKEPEGRYPSCTAFADDLRAAVREAAGHGGRARPVAANLVGPEPVAGRAPDAGRTAGAAAAERHPGAGALPHGGRDSPPRPAAGARSGSMAEHGDFARLHGDEASRRRPGTAPERPDAAHREATARTHHGGPAADTAPGWERRVHGALFGGAIGDALGAPVEDQLLRHIRQRYGAAGVTGVGSTYRATISEETQLTLFTVEALIRGSVRARGGGRGGGTMGFLQEGMLVWLESQGGSLPPQPFPLHSALVAYPELIDRRGTTQSVYRAMQRVADQADPHRVLGTPARPINDSKGCGAVMRSAPCGFGYAADRSGSLLREIFDVGCDAAALTHGHPGGWLPAGTLAAMIYLLCRGADLPTALDRARGELARHPGHDETSNALDTAAALADRLARAGRAPVPEDLEELGHGWVGPEALGIAVFAALVAEAARGPGHERVREGLLLSVNHSGDSDSTAAVAGSLLGARFGRDALPRRWAATLDAAPVLDRLATDYCAEFGLTPPVDEHGAPPRAWWDSYPGGPPRRRG